MGLKCKKCSNDISINKENFKCKDCDALFHPGCINSDVSKSVTTRNNWRCEKCNVSSHVGRGGESSREDSSILEAIAEFRKENNERWDSCNAKLDEFKSDLKSVKEDVSVLKATSSRNTSAVLDLNQQNELMRCQIDMLKKEVADLQQQTRKNNIIITGVPVSTQENVYMILEKLANVLKVEFNRFDISTAHRLRQGPAQPGKNPVPPSIVVSFVSRSVKSDWLIARKHKRTLSAREINRIFPDQPVYLNDHLATHTREVFNAARALVKTQQLVSVWTNDGRIMARKSTTGKPFRIHDLDDIRKIDNKTRVEAEGGSREVPITGAAVTQQTKTS
jgi:hypothetical protein